jgi:hypothetical protein
MPDIWERYGAGQIELHAFSPVWLKSSFGWNRPLIFGPVPAENVSWLLQKRAETTPCTRKTPGIGVFQIVAFPPRARFLLPLIGMMGTLATSSNSTRMEYYLLDYCRKSTIE